MDRLFRQVSVKDREPEKYGYYDTNVGNIEYSPSPGYGWQYGMPYPDYWLEEIELPSEENLTTNVLYHNNTVYHDINMQEACNNGIKMCYNYILNTLKGEKSNV